jgi:hypothetical protein
MLGHRFAACFSVPCDVARIDAHLSGTVTPGQPRWWQRRIALPALAQDGLMFLASSVFAALLWSSSSLSAHRDWSRDAFGGYLACAVIAGVLCVARPSRELVVRIALTAVCFAVVALLPLVLMVRARAETTSESHILPEAAVIERAGTLLAHGRDPYVANLVGGRLVGRVAGVPRYEAFFPYFPAMTAFGLPSSVHALGAFGDSRLWMAAFTFLALLAGLFLARAPPARTLRVVQVMCVLPTGALFVAGGGDDLPVLAISLVGAAAIAKRRDVLGAVAFGIAMAMKFTAWPLALLAGVVIYRRDGARPATRALGITAAIVAAFVIPFAVWGPRTFLVNTVAFPLGLSGVDSPAASPLPGHVIAALVPAARRVLLVGLVIVGTPILVWWLRRRPPGDVASACRLTAVVAIVVMCVAPATRVGYVVYPLNLLVWSWLLTPESGPTGGTGVLGASGYSSSPTSKSRNT